MSRPVPLMFVSSPPVFERVSVEGEESTSIFEQEIEVTKEVEAPIERKEVDPLVLKKVERLRSSIAQRVFQGLTFVLADEEITGNVGKIEGQTITINVDGDEEKAITVEFHQLKNILWRGQPLPEN